MLGLAAMKRRAELRSAAMMDNKDERPPPWELGGHIPGKDKYGS